MVEKSYYFDSIVLSILYSPHPHDSGRFSPLRCSISFSSTLPRPFAGLHAPIQHPTLPSCGRPPESPPPLGTQHHLLSNHPLPLLRLTAAPTPCPLSSPAHTPRPGPSSPESASAAASPPALPAPRSRAAAPALPNLTSALSARRPPRRPRPAHAGGWGGGRSAQLPAGSRPPSCSPSPPRASARYFVSVSATAGRK